LASTAAILCKITRMTTIVSLRVIPWSPVLQLIVVFSSICG